MAFVSVYLGLGSNQGNREKNILGALRKLDEAFGVHFTALSRLIETEAMGFKGDKFLNGCVLYRVFREEPASAHAHRILSFCKRIEKELGRTDSAGTDASGNRVYHNRPIDIDLLFYGAEIIQSETLTIPHPRMAERPFVTIPLAEIAKPSLKAAFPEIFG